MKIKMQNKSVGHRLEMQNKAITPIYQGDTYHGLPLELQEYADFQNEKAEKEKQDADLLETLKKFTKSLKKGK